MKRGIMILGFVVFQIVMIASIDLSAEVIKDAPRDLLPAAEKIISEKFENPLWQKEAFPPYFQPWDDFTDFKLGKPFPQYKLHMDVIYKLENSSDFVDSMKFLVWLVPIYLGEEEEPRTFLGVKKKDDGNWYFGGMGGDPQHLILARKNWPIDEGYKHASLICTIKVPLIMLEKDNELQFYYYRNDDGGERIFGISKQNNGSYPIFSKEYLINNVKSDERYINKESVLKLVEN